MGYIKCVFEFLIYLNNKIKPIFFFQLGMYIAVFNVSCIDKPKSFAHLFYVFGKFMSIHGKYINWPLFYFKI